MDEYSILRKKRKKNGFASTALLISIAIALIAMVGAVLILNKVDTSKRLATNENSTVEELTDKKDATCEGLTKEIVFNSNINSIKEAATSYFTNERLPQNIGDKVTITLKEMISNKLVRNVLDASGKSCNASDSYVEITKENNEYVMKIFLSCSDLEDYIIVHLGCYDYCDKDICEKKEEQVKAYEYEYKKVIDCTLGEWSNWGEWKTTREKTSNLKKEDIKVETISKNDIETKEASKKAITYNCDKYSGYTLVGDKCVKETTTTDVKDAISSSYSYNCDNYPGYSVVGDKCVKEEKIKEVVEALKTEPVSYCPNEYRLNGDKCEKDIYEFETKNAILTCPSGYNLKGEKCYKTITRTETKEATPTCPSGYNLKGEKCYKTTTRTETKEATPTCPSGYNLKDGKCYKTVYDIDLKDVLYTCPNGYKLQNGVCSKVVYSTNTVEAEAVYKTVTDTKYYTCKKEECTTKSVFSCPTGKSCGTYPQTSCVTVNKTCSKKVDSTYISEYKCPQEYTLNEYKDKDGNIIRNCTKKVSSMETRPANPTCPSGYRIFGKKCYGQVSKTDIKDVSYTCPNGYSKNGKTCSISISKTDMKDAIYTCPNGYSKNGKTCSIEISNTDIKNADYVCENGYNKNGKTCEKTNVKKEKIDAKKTNIELYCKDGYNLKDNKCERIITTKDTKAATKVNGGYVCDDGYSLSDTKCTKKVTHKDIKDATANSLVYYCENGYKLDGTKCIKTIEKTVKNTYYRYATRSCTGGSTNYEWSNSNKDEELLNSGYVLTGKKREISK